MTLNHHPDYPSARYYVLKIHRDADGASGALRGRVEHVATGEQFEFASTPALIAALGRHLEDLDSGGSRAAAAGSCRS